MGGVPGDIVGERKEGVEGVSHISIQVRDIERSLPFYRDVLGMAVSSDREIDLHGVRNGEQIHVRRRIVFLRWEDRPGATFVLLSQDIDREPVGRPTQLGELGIDHVALIVDDVEAVVARAKAFGEQIVMEPHHASGEDYGHLGGGDILSAMLRDPDGTLVQVDRWL